MKRVRQMDNTDATARQRAGRDGGQTLLEFALLLPMLMLVAVGIVDMGRAIYYTICVNNGATAGAEFASRDEISASNTTGIKNTAICDANGGSPPPTGTCHNGILTVANVIVNHGCACDTGIGTSCNPMPGNGTCGGMSCNASGQLIVECVQVKTTATYSPLFYWPGIPNSLTANGNAIMRVRK